MTRKKKNPDACTARIVIKLTEAEKETFDAQAKREGLGTGTWLKQLARARSGLASASAASPPVQP